MLIVSTSEGFFIDKIKEGLSYSYDELSFPEEALLTCHVLKLPDWEEAKPEALAKLTAKCVGALSEAYARDTAGKNRMAAVDWREHNVNLYNTSELVLTGVVQQWYLSVGRAQEKRVGGCLTLLVVGFGLLAFIGL